MQNSRKNNVKYAGHYLEKNPKKLYVHLCMFLSCCQKSKNENLMRIKVNWKKY